MAASLNGQTVTTSHLPGLRITQATYNPDERKLSVELRCESESPITAWAVAFTSRSMGNKDRTGSQSSDYLVQLSYNDHRPATSTGVCYQGQTRLLNFGIDPLPGAIDLRVTAVVYADNTTSGEEEALGQLQQMRRQELARIRSWLDVLETLRSSDDIPAAAQLQRRQKLRESARSVTAEMEAKSLEQMLRAFDRGVDPAAALDDQLGVIRKQETVYLSALGL